MYSARETFSASESDLREVCYYVLMPEETHLSVVGSSPDVAEVDSPKGRSANRPRARYALPTDRLKFQAQIDALRAFAALSKSRQESVSSEQLAGYLKVAVGTAGLSNIFFVESGLIEKAGKGRYLPSEAVIEFQRKYTFNPQSAGPTLGPALGKTWYADVVRQRIEFGQATVDDLIDVLAAEAGADASFRAQLECLLEWLQLGNVIAFGPDGHARMVGELEAIATGVAEPTVDRGSPPSIGEEPNTGVASPTPRLSRRTGEPPVLSLSFELRLSASDLAALSGDQIRQLFDGVGQIAAIRATLGDA
jgi:hypothetical protein